MQSSGQQKYGDGLIVQATSWEQSQSHGCDGGLISMCNGVCPIMELIILVSSLL